VGGYPLMFLLDNLFNLIIAGLVLLLAILAIFMPLFVMQIRDSTKWMEKKMDRIIKLSFAVKKHAKERDSFLKLLEK
jgi:hypothetical protein